MAAKSSMLTERVVFIDRDGVINRKAAPQCYIRQWSEFVFLPRAAEAVSLLNQNGYRVLIVSNQRGLATGMLTWAELDSLHKRMRAALAAAGAHIDGIYICPHDIDQCDCRKPLPGLLYQAERDFAIDKSRSWMVGDTDSDMAAGRAYGVRTILLNKSGGPADHRCDTFFQAALYIIDTGEDDK